MSQRTFSPTDHIEFFEDGSYHFDYTEAHTQARKERDAEARALKAEGHRVRRSTLKGQRISVGGIGSGKPHLQFVVTVYMLSF